MTVRFFRSEWSSYSKPTRWGQSCCICVGLVLSKWHLVKYMVLSLGEEKPRSCMSSAESKIQNSWFPPRLRDRMTFCNDSVLRKVPFRKHHIVLLFRELLFHGIPFGSPRAWLAPLCREARLYPEQKYCFLLFLFPVHNLAWSDHLNRIKENKGLFLYSQNKQQQQ